MRMIWVFDYFARVVVTFSNLVYKLECHSHISRTVSTGQEYVEKKSGISVNCYFSQENYWFLLLSAMRPKCSFNVFATTASTKFSVATTNWPKSGQEKSGKSR